MIRVGSLVKLSNIFGAPSAGRIGIVIEKISPDGVSPNYRVLIDEIIHELWAYEMEVIST